MFTSLSELWPDSDQNLFSLAAPVARFLRYFETPLLTAGALTADYTLPKTTKESEYFLTTRTGHGFAEMSHFLISVFNK